MSHYIKVCEGKERRLQTLQNGLNQCLSKVETSPDWVLVGITAVIWGVIGTVIGSNIRH